MSEAGITHFTIFTHFNILNILILRRKFHALEILPILTSNELFVSAVQFLLKTHNKTIRFFAFFPFFPLFVQKVRRFLTFFAFF